MTQQECFMPIISTSNPLLESFFSQFDGKNRPCLILDYDGTLAPFKVKRLEATPYPEVKKALQNIVKNKHTQISIVSGRNALEVKTLLDITPSPEIWGCHGWEHLCKDGVLKVAPLPTNVSHGLEIARFSAENTPYGEFIEWKGTSIAVHWRGCSTTLKKSLETEFKAQWEKLTKSHSLELIHFDGGYELRPLGFNKYDAVKTILEDRQGKGPVAYLGDDITDEDAFAAMKDVGLSVLVKNENKESLSDIQLKPPGELLDFLNLWIKMEDSFRARS